MSVKQREIKFAGRRLTFRDTRLHLTRTDLVIVEQARRNVDTYVSLLRSLPRVAMWGHGRDHVQQARLLDAAILTRLTNRATWFFGYTPASVEAVVERGFDRKRTTVLWNTTDATQLRKDLSSVTAEEVAAFRSRHGSGGPIALYVGGLDSSKRIPFLLGAFDLLTRELPDASLAILGRGSDEALLSEAARTRAWLYPGPPVFGRELAIALRAADALAMPGRVGLIAVDAIVANVPVVTTAWPYHAPEHAYLSTENSAQSEDSPIAYARTLAAVLSDTSMNRSLRAGCAKIAPTFSIEKMALRFVDGIEDALTSVS
ncbi:glycosyltransferase [Microbacterium sp. SCN 69-37]|uniref:glycosyltransferase n=1 Tax=Microbacterium sp. SCN 69-37 TaxID=1660115 RepID=UPI0025F7784B|nr:glycosyltransferase [Microbacterium sp. SCN 69-37]